MGISIHTSCRNCKYFKRGIDLMPYCTKGLDTDDYLDSFRRCKQWEERDFIWVNEKFIKEM